MPNDQQGNALHLPLETNLKGMHSFWQFAECDNFYSFNRLQTHTNTQAQLGEVCAHLLPYKQTHTHTHTPEVCQRVSVCGIHKATGDRARRICAFAQRSKLKRQKQSDFIKAFEILKRIQSACGRVFAYVCGCVCVCRLLCGICDNLCPIVVPQPRLSLVPGSSARHL